MRIDVGDGVRLFVDVEGPELVPDGPRMRTRPTLVLLHGGQVDHSWFKPHFQARLGDVAQLVYIDHRGFGHSDKGTPEEWNITTWADDVHRVCTTLGIDARVVLGSSLGGFVALRYAARHPDHIGKLILASTTARENSDRRAAARDRLGGRMANFEWTEDELARFPPCEDVMEHWLEHEAPGRDQRPDLAAVRCPVLVIAGELDPMATIEDAEEIVAALPPDQARFERVEGAGHGVCRDAPDRFFTAVREFLLS